MGMMVMNAEERLYGMMAVVEEQQKVFKHLTGAI